MATTWRADPLEVAQRKESVHTALHRYAGQRGFSCLPKASSIDRGRYFAEINQYVGEGSLRPNVKMGTGDTPLDAALDGYLKAMPGDIVLAAFAMEVECYRFKQAIYREQAQMAKLEKAIDLLTACVRMVNPEQ